MESALWPWDISPKLVKDLTKTAWETVPSHSLPIAPIQVVNPDTYHSDCSESAYVMLQVDFKRLIAYFGQFGCPHQPHRSLRRD